MSLASNALTTVATVAAEVGIATPASGSASEAYLERIINTASGAIERYLNRTLVKATVTEQVKGYGTALLLVSRTPVLSITSVSYGEEDAETVSATLYTATDEEKAKGFIRYKGGTWDNTALYLPGASYERMPGSEEPLYTVVYLGGYVLPKDDSVGTPRTLPHEIEEACIRTCVNLYRSRGRDPNVLSETLLSASRTYAGSTSNTAIGRGEGGIIPDDALPLLKPHKRW